MKSRKPVVKKKIIKFEDIKKSKEQKIREKVINHILEQAKKLDW